MADIIINDKTEDGNKMIILAKEGVTKEDIDETRKIISEMQKDLIDPK